MSGGGGSVSIDLPRAALPSDDEQGIRALLDNIRDYAIFMLDPEGRIVSWNEGARRIKGYTEAEILGRHISRFYTPEDIAAGKSERLLREAAREGRIVDQGWRVRKDGTQFWAEAILSSIRDASGNLQGYIKITRDLTERRRAEEELAARAQQQQTIAEFGLFALQT